MRNRGNVMTEYGIVIGLVAIAGILGLVFFGDDVSALLTHREVTGQNTTLNHMNVMDFGIKKKRSAAEEDEDKYNEPYYEIVFDENGIPHFVPTQANSDASVATTDHGDGFAIDTLSLAKQLDALAAKYAAEGKTDLAKQLRDAATAAYYLAGAEGELDKVAGLTIPPVDAANSLQYSKENALNDVLKYKDQLKAFINNADLMAQLEPVDRVKAAAYAADAYNIGQKYANGLGDFISKDGQVTKNFAFSEQGNTGTGAEGSSIRMAEKGVLSTQYNQLLSTQQLSYSNYFSPSQIRQRANAVLQERSGTSNVNVTITNGALQDRLASNY